MSGVHPDGTTTIIGTANNILDNLLAEKKAPSRDPRAPMPKAPGHFNRALEVSCVRPNPADESNLANAIRVGSASSMRATWTELDTRSSPADTNHVWQMATHFS